MHADILMRADECVPVYLTDHSRKASSKRKTHLGGKKKIILFPKGLKITTR